MKVYYKIAIVAFLLILLSGSSSEKPETPQKLVGFINWYIYSYDKMLELSDIIAEVQIKKVLREVDTILPKTIFRAKVIDAYKMTDDPEKEIDITQPGNSKIEFSHFELFKKGDRLILFLSKNSEKDLEGTYGIIGLVGGTFYVERIGWKDYVFNKIHFIPEVMMPLVDVEAGEKYKKRKGLYYSGNYNLVRKDVFKNQILKDIREKENNE